MLEGPFFQINLRTLIEKLVKCGQFLSKCWVDSSLILQEFNVKNVLQNRKPAADLHSWGVGPAVGDNKALLRVVRGQIPVALATTTNHETLTKLDHLYNNEGRFASDCLCQYGMWVTNVEIRNPLAVVRGR